MKTKQLLHYVLIVFFAVSITACSDNGTDSGEEEQPPAIPELAAKAQPDISFFQNNNPSGAALKGVTNATVQNFNSAKGTVIGGAAFLSIGQIYTGFINPASQANADFEDGQWVWEYNASQGGQSLSIRTTARPQGNGFSWSTFISFDDGEGNSVSDFKIMEGTTSNNGNQGSWTFFSFTDNENDSFPVLTSSWSVESETASSIDLEIFDEDGVTAGTISYQRNGAENLMTLNISGEGDQAEVFWNTDTNAGYFMQGAEKTCWNSSFQDTSCSAVGL